MTLKNFVKEKIVSNRFCTVPNSIIEYSCKINPYVLPLYIWFFTKADFSNEGLIDTNLSLARETFIVSGKKCALDKQIKEAFHYLVSSGQYSIFSSKYDISQVSGENRLLLYINADNINLKNGYTIADFDEFTYLTEWAYTQYINNTGVQKKEINTLMLLNLYFYIKMKILKFAALNKQSQEKHYMNESVNYIADYFHKGNRTIVFYLGLLEKLQMLNCNVRQQQELAFGKGHGTEMSGYKINREWKNSLTK